MRPGLNQTVKTRTKINSNSASDGGDSKMSSMLPMMMMMSPQGSGSNPMLPMILGMMGKSHDI